MPPDQAQPIDEFQITDGPVEPGGPGDMAPVEEEPSGPRSRKRGGGTGFGDTKKLIILGALLALGVGVVAWQFLRARGAKPATATPTAPAATMPSSVNNTEIQTVLRRLERPNAGEEFSVARVEQLVNEFDSYVRDRQVPLAHLKGDPFQVTLREKGPSPEEIARAEAEAAAAAAAAAAEMEAQEAREAAEREAARLRQIRETAGRLSLGSILIGGGRRMAVINGRVCLEGDVVAGFTIEEIANSRVTLTFDDTTVNLDLFAGTGRPR